MMLASKFIALGTSAKHPEENDMIKLYNGMALLSLIGCIIMLLTSISFGIDRVYVLVTIALSSFYFCVIVFNISGFYAFARLFVCAGSPIWICGCILTVGGFFCQGAAIISSMAITFVTCRDRKLLRNGLLLFNFACFALPTIYISFFGPFNILPDVPFDEIVVFLASVGWAVILIYKYERDRSKILVDLQSNVVDLKETTTELEQFTYIASHDLKAPLQTILSFTQLVENDLINKNYDNIYEKFDFIKSSANQMHYLVEDILEMSLLKENTETKRIDISLNDILNKAKLNLTDEIKSKKAVIKAESLPNYRGKELELLLLFQNLIQNGIKYNRSHTPTINISSVTKKDKLILKFRDNGIGISDKHYELVFQFFKRLHNRKEFKGTGLGLGLCKKIVTSYNGQIDIQSEINKGSTFTITLPIT